MTASSQIAQGGGAGTAFCLNRITAGYTFGTVGDDALFKNDYDTTGVLIFTQNYAVADAKEITVTVTYKLDTVAINPAVSFNFKVTTKAVCGSPTFTVPAAQSTTASLYIGRTMSVTWDAWTVSPSFCKFVYVVDTSAAFSSSASKFTVDVAARTVSIASSTTFTNDETKEWTVAVTAKHPDNSGTAVAGKSYDFKVTIAADPCELSTPTQVVVTANEAKTWDCTMIQTDSCTFDVAMAWNPSVCDSTATYGIKYGTGLAGDAAYDLSADSNEYLKYDASTKKLTLKNTTPTDKAATGLTIEVTGKTAGGVVIPTAGNKQTITLNLVDPCQAATATFAAVTDVVYTLGEADATFQWVKPTISPTECNSGEIVFDSDYEVTIPTAIADIITPAPVAGNNKPYTLTSTNLEKYVGTHEFTVQAKDETTKLSTALKFNVIIKSTCDSVSVTLPTLSAANW